MSQKEVQRLAVIGQVLQGGLGQAQAAQMLGVSVRQIKRLCLRLRQQGAAGLIGVAPYSRIGATMGGVQGMPLEWQIQRQGECAGLFQGRR